MRHAVGGKLAVTVGWLLATLVGGCSGSGPSPLIDGWPIGEPYVCDVPTARSGNCTTEVADLVRTAQAGLDRRNPGHAAVAKLTLHHEGVLANGGLLTRSGLCHVALFTLSDGNVRAIGVCYPGISTVPQAVDYGP